MKKRIFAASMASVMALSSVSVVAFADETKADFGETVTKAELKEAIKQYDETLKNIDSYGSTQALRFQEAYDHAKLVASDADADATDATAAYQMLKAVASKLVQHTNAELKELVEDNKDIYERNNVLNEEIMDTIYNEEAFLKFKNAYEEAESTVDVDDLMLVTDAYIALDEAAANLELNKLTPVLKTEYRKIIREYENMLAQFSKTESWRRGKVSVKPTTGAPKNASDDALDLTAATYVTWGELMNIVNGASDEDVVVAVKDKATADDVIKPVASTWIAVSAGATKTVEALIYEQSRVFDDYKAATRTTDPTIMSGYNAAKEAIAVFNSWKAIDADSTVKSQATKTLNKYRIQLAKDFEQDLAKSLESTSIDGLYFEKDGTDTAALEITTDGKLVGVAGAAKAGCVLRIVSSTGLIQLDTDDPTASSSATGAYAPNPINGVKSYTVKIVEGEDYMKYIPVRSSNVKTNSVYSKDDAGKIANVSAALAILEAYNTESNKPAKDQKWDVVYTKMNTTGNAEEKAGTAFKDADDVKDLDENETVTKPAGTAREYTFINRYLTYALQDLYPEQAEDCKHTRKDIEALIVKAYDLIDETGNSNIFAVANEELAAARKEAVEWVRESKKDLKYKDNDADHGLFPLGTTTNASANAVYHTLSCAANAKYDALATLLAQYPISYGEIAEKIADVNGDVEDGVYGEKVKLAADDVAYALSVLKAKDEGNEAFDDERAFNGYNRLFVDADNSTDEEKNLKAALDALDEAIKAGETGDVVLGDVDGDGQPTAKDAKLVLQYAAGQIELTAAQIKAADFDGDGVPTAKDAKAILMAAAGMTE